MSARPATVDATAAAALTGLPVRAIHPLIGGRENTTQLIEITGTGRVLLQQLRTRTGAGHRLRLASAVPPAAARAGVPVPAVVAADATSDPAWLVRRFVEGRSATATLRHPPQALRMAAGAGRWCAQWRTIEPVGMRPYRLWAEPRRLASAAARWLERTAADLPDEVTAVLGDDVAALQPLLAGRPAVLAHGDFTAANLLVDSHGRPVAVIDVEFARLADPLFDPAWFRGALLLWGPDTWADVWEAFWNAYRARAIELGLEDAAEHELTDSRLATLGRVRLLEIVEHTRTRPDAALWRGRLRRLATEGATPG